MNRVLIISLLLIASIYNTFSQLDEFTPLERRAWFLGQRSYPYDAIPTSAYYDAYLEKIALIQSQGYYLGPQLQWQELGPKPYGSSWDNVSGRVADIEYDPSDQYGNTIYIAAGEGGIWKSENGGLNWSVLDDQLPSLTSGCLTIDAENNIIYYATGSGPHVYGLGVFKSTNGGLNWTSIWNVENNPCLPKTTCIYGMAIRPEHPDEIFVADMGGLFRTLDGGANWERVIPSSGQALWCTDVAFSDENTVLAVGPKPTYFDPPFSGIGLWRSSDGGSNFYVLDESCGFPDQPNVNYDYGRTQLATSIDDEGLFYILTYYDQTLNNYVYKSTNYGVNFIVMNNGNSVYNTGGNSGYNHVIKCSQSNSDILFVGFQDLYVSMNGAGSFTEVTSTMHPDFHSIAFNPVDANEIICGNDGGIAMSSDGGLNWYWDNPMLNHDLGITESYHVGSSFYNSDIVLCGIQDEGIGIKESTNSTYWVTTSVGGGDGTNVLYSPFKASILLASYVIYWQEVFYSSNNLSTHSTPISGNNRSTPVTPLAHHPKIPGLCYNVRNNGEGNDEIRFYKSTNYGQNFTYTSFSLDQQQEHEGTPQTIAVSPSNPDIIMFSIGDYSDFWNRTNQIYKTTDGGLTWDWIRNIHQIIPDRYFSHLEFDPTDEHTFYVTLSGFGAGHVFRTTNDGTNWTDISEHLPDCPANDLIIRFPDATSKELIVATDMGVYRSDADDISWEELATDLPNNHIIDIDLHRLSNKLRASAFGRGIWEVELPGDVYVQDCMYITDNTSINKNIVVCSGGKLILGYENFPSFNISFEDNSKIVVQDGGELDASSGNTITLTSQSSTWGGIEIQDNAEATLNNITFQNSSTPIVITGTGAEITNDINIENCNFYDGNVQIDSRNLVTVKDCHWYYNSGTPPDPFMVSSVGSDNVNISGNVFQPASLLSTTGIQVVYGSTVTISGNTISNTANGIIVSNSSPSILNNTISTSSTNESGSGIGLDYGYSAILNENSISGYYLYGFKFGNSSPTMLYNSSVTSLNDDETYALSCSYYSSPRLRPSYDGDELIEDAGYNTLINNKNGIWLTYSSLPDIDHGHNVINGEDIYDMAGDVPFGGLYYYPAECNSWIDYEPEFNISGAIVDYEPYDPNCDGGDGGGGSYTYSKPLAPLLDPDLEDPVLNPPQPLIVNHGNGIFDTIWVVNKSLQVSADRELFSQAMKQELLGNYMDAISKYYQLIQNYQDNSTAIDALNHILHCNDRKGADSNSYVQLRTYYLTLVQNNQTDTEFVTVAKELATKSLVRMGLYSNAITEYENEISNNNDTLQILFTELNIIETYLLIQQQGDAPTFTGKLSYLKPNSVQDGLAKIRQKFYKVTGSTKTKLIPKEFKLAQNYPNPFNPITTISYSLPQNTKVVIKVYDILGRLVKELVNEYKEVGVYSVKFDGSNLASGIYLYKIEAGTFIDTKKMVLVK